MSMRHQNEQQSKRKAISCQKRNKWKINFNLYENTPHPFEAKIIQCGSLHKQPNDLSTPFARGKKEDF